mmetsp:Transcript_57959/g.137972  ORF Transcript_57959/g.137972 Transcript_57959/m.137972 type:complete len:462 (-) Transcript_57959:150-1535(-)
MSMFSSNGFPWLFVFVVVHRNGCVGHELHGGHQASHATALWRRSPLRLPSAHKKRRASHQHLQVEVSASAEARRMRVVNLTTPLQDMKSEYIGEVGVGTTDSGDPQFRARVVFDTGSTNLWVASVLCKELPCKNDGVSYDPALSLTQEMYEGAGEDVDIKFGTGELRGPIHVDTYRVGPMVVKQQPFAMIREMNGAVFSAFPFEGILGLAFPSLSFGGITPFFERVIEQKLLPSNEFSFYLNIDRSQPSALLWGGIDEDLFEGPIHMFPVVQPHYWALELVDFLMGNVSLAQPDSEFPRLKRLVIDSGTTYFTAPDSIHDLIVDRIREADCRDVEEYPMLTYVLRAADGQTYNLEVSQETYMVGDTHGTCRPAFMALDVKPKYGPAMILGEVFMSHFFTVFSRGDGSMKQAKVGFAPARVGAMPKVRKDPPAFIQESEEVAPKSAMIRRQVFADATSASVE